MIRDSSIIKFESNIVLILYEVRNVNVLLSGTEDQNNINIHKFDPKFLCLCKY